MPLGRVWRRRRAPQLGLDARQQLDHLERLRDVVVGAELQADDLVDDLPARGEHDDRRLDAAFAQLAHDVEAAEARQHDVEETRSNASAEARSRPLSPSVLASTA